MSYLIKNNNVIAETSKFIKSGTIVNYSYHSIDESINANFDKTLVNSQHAKVSNAKKYDVANELRTSAIVLDDHFPNDFLLVD